MGKDTKEKKAFIIQILRGSIYKYNTNTKSSRKFYGLSSQRGFVAADFCVFVQMHLCAPYTSVWIFVRVDNPYTHDVKIFRMKIIGSKVFNF